MGLTGAVLLAVSGLNDGQSSGIGVALILIALVSYGFALSIARSLQQRYGAIPVIWRAQGMALHLTAPLGLSDLVSAKWTPLPLLSLIALGTFGTAIANVLMASAAGRFGAARPSGTTPSDSSSGARIRYGCTPRKSGVALDCRGRGAPDGIQADEAGCQSLTSHDESARRYRWTAPNLLGVLTVGRMKRSQEESTR